MSRGNRDTIDQRQRLKTKILCAERSKIYSASSLANMWYYRSMLEKLPGYTLLSVLSFCIFTLLFHTVAYAEGGLVLIPSPTPIETVTTEPTPTMYELPPTNPTQVPTFLFVNEKDQPTPTAIPTPAPTITVVAELAALFQTHSNTYHVDTELLKKIARCESGFNTAANNGIYMGMFQFAAQTWSVNRARMGLDPNPDLRTNAEEAIRTAAFMIANGGINAWPNCK